MLFACNNDNEGTSDKGNRETSDGGGTSDEGTSSKGNRQISDEGTSNKGNRQISDGGTSSKGNRQISDEGTSSKGNRQTSDEGNGNSSELDASIEAEIKKIVNANFDNINDSVLIKTTKGATKYPLLIALCRDYQTLAKKALDHSQIDVNKTGKGNLTALMMICLVTNDIDLLKKIIEKGAKIDLINDDGTNALFVAVQKQKTEMAKILVENRANPTRVLTVNGKKTTSLHKAIFLKDLDLVKALLSKPGVNLDPGDESLLLEAFNEYQQTIAKELIEYGS